MKKYIYILMAAFIFNAGCEDTNENPVQNRGENAVPFMSDPSPAYFSDNIEASYVQFNLSLPSDQTIEKAEIEVTKGNKSAILKGVSIPSSGVRVTATEVLNALKIPVSDYKLGDIFNLYILTTKNGKTTRSAAAFQIPVVCYFDTSMLVGEFDYESDDWGEAGRVTFVADANDPYKIFIDGYPQSEGLTGNGNRIELNVNKDNFKVTGPPVIISDNLDEWGLPPTYTNYTFTPIAGLYSACDEMFTITFDIKVSIGGWGANVFIFKKVK